MRLFISSYLLPETFIYLFIRWLPLLLYWYFPMEAS